MASILDNYRVLGVSVGAGIADITASYKRLCRIYHPDINDDPASEEQMKIINAAYSVLREKLRREAAMRERTAFSRAARRYAGPEARAGGSDASRAGNVTEKEAFSVLQNYFKALITYDYSGAYDFLSNYDRRNITRDSFILWRASVSRLFPMREFSVDGRSTAASVELSDERIIPARKFAVRVTEEDLIEHTMSSGEVDKLVINENGICKVFLGYKNVGDLTRTFDERFEDGKKQHVAKRFDEYYDGLYPEYDMHSSTGMRRAVMRELYRHKRFGGKLTFAVISIKAEGIAEAGQAELLRSAARTINSSLRETDIPAYLGDGIFAVLFVELRKKNADEIIARLADAIKANAGEQLGRKADIEKAYQSWSDNGLADIDALNKVLVKFRKKL